MSDSRTPPWRDRLATHAATPPVTAPRRQASGRWNTWRRPDGPPDEAANEARFHKKLPASWRSAVRDLPLPMWARRALSWLLDVPRWILFTVGGVVLLVGLSGTITAVAMYNYLSKPVAIPTPIVGSGTQTGHIYAADGTLLADLHGSVNRQSVPLDQISTPLKQAVLAAEDSSFYSHKALDFTSLIRAGFSDLLAGKWIEGGSSITQQYVKLVYVGDQRTLRRKIEEARLAYQIERRLSKDEIFDRYLNTVYFGRGAYGVQAAALTFFNKPASQLDAAESSLLAGVLVSPTAYSPDNNPDAAEVRRQYVVGRMEALGYLTPAAAEQIRTNKPVLSAPPSPTTIAYKYPWYVDTVRKYLFSKYGEALTLGGGLNVQTTLNPAQQNAADAAVTKALPKDTDPYSAMVSVDPKTGYVTAMVGGRDFAAEKFNLATQGRRQPGSAMKPFVLIAALEKGISPLTVYDGPAQICLANWLPTCTVTSYNNESFGAITLETATIHSVNTVYAQLIMQVGPQSVVQVANAMGVPGPRWLLNSVPGCRPVGSPDCYDHLTAEPSLALGSNDVSPLEMASAYATLADHGVYHEPKFVSAVTDSTGKVLENGPNPGVQVVNPAIVTTVDRILHEVVTMGTGTGADIGRPEAGKTGTTSDFRNAWFVGYTPELATATWVGYRNANLPLLGVEGVPQMAGGTIPATIWANYMKAALPKATPDILAADSADMGLTNAPVAGVTQTVAGGQDVTSSVLPASGPPAFCQLLASTTAVAPLGSPTPGPTYNVYPYLRCGNAAFVPNTAPASPSTSDTATPAPSDTGPVYPTDHPVIPPSQPATVPTQPSCVLSILCNPSVLPP